VRLRNSFATHSVTTVYELGWDEYENGALLTIAQDFYDVLITTDANMQYQQRLPGYDIGLIVLRAFNTKLESYLPLVPDIEMILANLQPGEVVYVYADQKLAEKDKRKGQKKKDAK
jgi:hypothetical protein